MWSGLRALLDGLQGQHVADTKMVRHIILLAVQRQRVLLDALVGLRTDPHNKWGLHWQDAASCFVELSVLFRPTAAVEGGTADVAAAVLLRLLPALRGEPRDRVEQCMLSCLESLALPWHLAPGMADPQHLTPANLLSCLESLALCASGTLALRKAQLARHSQPPRLDQTGLTFTAVVAGVLRMMKSGAPWHGTAGEQQERLVAGALAAAEAVVRLLGGLVQEEDVQLEGICALALATLVQAAKLALNKLHYVCYPTEQTCPCPP